MVKLAIRSVLFLAALSALNTVPEAYGNEKIIQFHSIIDPNLNTDGSVCMQAPFPPTVQFSSGAWIYETRGSDGTIVNSSSHVVGVVRDCVQITDFSFTPFSVHPFYIRFDLRDATYIGNGSCTVISNNVPVTGLILVSCVASLADFATGEPVGSGVSSVSFNPFGLPGFDTGAYWTLRLYTGE